MNINNNKPRKSAPSTSDAGRNNNLLIISKFIYALFPKRIIQLGRSSKLPTLKQWPRWKIIYKKKRVQFIPFPPFACSQTSFFSVLLHFPGSQHLWAGCPQALPLCPPTFSAPENRTTFLFPLWPLRAMGAYRGSYVQKLRRDSPSLLSPNAI